jgi:hypothetical protein
LISQDNDGDDDNYDYDSVGDDSDYDDDDDRSVVDDDDSANDYYRWMGTTGLDHLLHRGEVSL